MQKLLQNALPTNGGWHAKKPVFLGSKIFSVLARGVHYIEVRKREWKMFEVGDRVTMNGSDVRGVIVDFYYDEGNVWVVEVDGYPGIEMECADNELTNLPL
jgi:hypothetical protein